MLVVLGAFVLVAVGLVAVLVDLQTLRPERYVELGQSQRTRTRDLAGFRGSLVDRNGFVLAASTPGKELFAEPILVEDPAAVAALLSPILEEEATVLAQRLVPDTENDRYELLLRTSDERRVAEIADLLTNPDHRQTLRGIYFRSEEARVYPAGDLARPVVGRVDAWEQGTYGLEEQFNGLMQGSPGSLTSEQGTYGSIAGGLYELEPATQGYDMVLTLDHRIQFVVEQALIEHCEDKVAKRVQAVVSDPRTGDILAMATVERGENGACFVPGRNAPVVASYEPGSVLKVLAISAAVEELGWSSDTLVDVPLSITVADGVFHEHDGHVPALYPLSEVLADSLNVGTIDTALAVGPETLYDYYKAFGFGELSGLGIELEARGTVRSPDEWQGTDIASIAIGQGVTVNTLQVVSAYNTIANDGVFVSPRLVRAAIAADGTEHELEPQVSRRVVSAATANEVTGMLVDAVDHGTGTEAAILGYDVAGKTGTAWKVFDNGSGRLSYGTKRERRYTMSFAGFLPADDPQLTVVVSFDEPRDGGTAGAVAAPLFADIAQYALRILAVPPSGVTGDTGALVRAVPAPDPAVLDAAASPPEQEATPAPTVPATEATDAPPEGGASG